MLENNIKRLPLERDGRLEGIVTARDVVEAFQRRL
jgi:signal-transduction protein with cAMP-binding, CBS, and nucleotidyltransferase domain